MLMAICQCCHSYAVLQCRVKLPPYQGFFVSPTTSSIVICLVLHHNGLIVYRVDDGMDMRRLMEWMQTLQCG